MISIISFTLLHFLAVQSGFAAAAISYGTQNATALEQDLIHGDAAAAALLVKQNVAPAAASGAQPFPDNVVDDIFSAAVRIIEPIDASKQPLVTTISQFLALLKPINETALSNRFAYNFEGSLEYEGLSGRMGPGFTSEALVVVSALAPQTVYEAFLLAKNNSQTIQLVRNVVDKAPLNSATRATARNALLSAYGATQPNLQQAQGNTTIIGSFLFNSAYLSSYLRGASAASQIITSLLSQTAQNAQDKSDAIAQAIALGLGQREPDTTATIILVALSASSASTVQAGFAKATTANLNTMCSSQVAAQALGAKAGQAAAAAIPTVFGPDPCVLFKGNTGALYSSNQTTNCDPQLNENLIKTGIANKSDCTSAISQLRTTDAANCTTLNSTHVETEYSADGNGGTPLVTVGTCQVLFDAVQGQWLSCAQVADYASNLSTACGNSQMGTGGRFYLTAQSVHVLPSGIILSRTTS